LSNLALRKKISCEKGNMLEKKRAVKKKNVQEKSVSFREKEKV
jgi:hypothetical protein